MIGHGLRISTCVFLFAAVSRAAAQEPPGTIDSSFSASVDGQIQVVAIQPDGRIYIGGSFSFVNGLPRSCVARLHTNGTVDAGFNANVSGGGVRSILPDAMGNIIIGGGFSSVNSVERRSLARLLSDGNLDNSFVAGANGSVNALLRGEDDSIIIGGYFSEIYEGSLALPRNHITRLTPTGVDDGAFAPTNRGPNDRIWTMVRQPDGKVLVGGMFSTFDGLPSGPVVRLNADSSVDPSFSMSTDYSAGIRIVLQPDGKMIIVGSFSTVNGQPRQFVARLDSTGSLDPEFDSNLSWTGGYIHGVALDSAGRLYAAGSFTEINGLHRSRVIRLHPDGQLDTGFNIGDAPGNSVFSVATDAHDDLLAASGFAGTARPHTLIRVRGGASAVSAPVTVKPLTNITLAAGKQLVLSVDATGGPTLAFHWQKDGVPFAEYRASHTINYTVPADAGSYRVVVSNALGTATSEAEVTVQSAPPDIIRQPTNQIAYIGQRISFFGIATGVPQPGFQWQLNGVNIVGATNTLLVLSNLTLAHAGDYRFVATNVVGATSSVGQLTVFPAKTNAGAVDLDFKPSIGSSNGSILAGTFQPDGKLILIGNGAFPRVRRYLADGSPDPSFNASWTENRAIECLALQADGKIVIGGSFTDTFDPVVRNVARLHSDGTIDTSFNVAMELDTVRRIIVQPDGKILFAADAQFPSQVFLGRLLPDGQPDLNFRQQTRTNPNGSLLGTIYCDDLLLQHDGKIVVAGTAGSLGVRRFLAHGAPDMTFSRNNQGLFWSRHRLALRNDGRIVVGGITGETNRTLQLLHVDGSVDTNFMPEVRRSILAMAVQPDGKILIGGVFDNIQGVPRARMARLHADGSLDETYDIGDYPPGPGPSQLISAILLDSNCAAMVLGDFVEFNRYERPGLVRLLPDAPTPPQIVRQPASQTCVVGQTAKFSVDFSCAPLPSLQWFHDGIQLPGATAPLLVITNTVPIDAGGYTVVASNSLGSITSVVATLTLNPAPTNSGAVDISFYAGTGPDDSVYTAVEQPDGKVIIGGLFSSVNGIPRRRIARLNVDGSVDASFDPGAGPGSSRPVGGGGLAVLPPVIHALALQADGKIVVGGLFGSISGLQRQSLARLHPDGSPDSTFAPYPLSSGQTVYALARQPDGKLIVGTDDSDLRLIRLKPDGAVDSFINTLYYSVRALALLPDGRFLAGTAGTQRSLVRVNTNATLDTFSIYLNGGVNSIALVGNDYVIGGSFQAPSRFVARFTPTGAVAPGAWASLNINTPVESIVVDACDRIWVGGGMTNVNGLARRALARLHADGSVDSSFAPLADARVRQLVRGRNSRIFVLGDFSEINGVARPGIARLIEETPGLPSFVSQPTNYSNMQGKDFALSASVSCAPGATVQWQRNGIDVPGATNATLEIQNPKSHDTGDYRLVARNDFGSVTTAVATVTLAPAPTMPGDNDIGFYPPPAEDQNFVALALQGPSRIIVISGSPGAASQLRRYYTNGAPDLSFQAAGLVNPGCMALAPNGDIFIGSSGAVHRLDANGTRDTNFVVTLAGGIPEKLVVQPDGKVVIVGSFEQVNEVTHRRVARLNPDGILDPGFNTGEGADGTVECVALQTNGKILIGGSFTQVTGPEGWQRRPRLARLNSDGTLDTNFVSAFPHFPSATTAVGRVNAIAVQNDGLILAGGYFTNYGGQLQRNLIRVLPEGTLDPTFSHGLSNTVYDLVIQPDGKVIVGGDGPLLRLHRDGSFDSSFVSGGPPAASAFFSGIVSLALAPSGEIYIGGNFSHYDGFSRPSFARVHGDPRIFDFLLIEGGLRMSMYTDPGRTYHLEASPAGVINWTVLQTVAGNAGEQTFTDADPAGPRLYRIRVE